MDCRNAQILISLQLDGALANKENDELAEHLAGCRACARKLALGRRLSGALREMGREAVQAPPELCGLVMDKLRSERRPVLWRLPEAWRRAVAAAAAILLLAGGSAGVNAGLKIAGTEKTIVYAPSPTVNDSPGGTAPGTLPDPGGAPPQGDLFAEPAGDPPAAPDESRPENPAGNTAQSGAPDAGGSAIVTDVPATDGPLALLSSELRINSTVLKVSVADLAETRARSVAMAAGAGAATQVFPEGKNDVMIRLTVAADKAPGLVADLAGIGTLLDREDASNNVTRSYNETVIQYNDLQSRLSGARDDTERQGLQSQAAACRQLLDAWRAESGMRVITLWLEGR